MRQNRKNRNSVIKKRIGNAGALLLEIAEKLDWLLSPQYFMDFAQYQDLEYRKQLKEQRQYLYYLKQQRYIEMEKLGEKLAVRLTDIGRHRAFRNKIKSTKDKCKNGNCYFVIFDVPEKERMVRNLLRSFLKECGFKKVQQSIWMTDCEILEPLSHLLKGRDLAKWVRVISGKIAPLSLMESIDLKIKKKANR